MLNRRIYEELQKKVSLPTEEVEKYSLIIEEWCSAEGEEHVKTFDLGGITLMAEKSGSDLRISHTAVLGLSNGRRTCEDTSFKIKIPLDE